MQFRDAIVAKTDKKICTRRVQTPPKLLHCVTWPSVYSWREGRPPTVEAKYSIESLICIIGNVVDSGLHQALRHGQHACCSMLGYIPKLHAGSPASWSWTPGWSEKLIPYPHPDMDHHQKLITSRRTLGPIPGPIKRQVVWCRRTAALEQAACGRLTVSANPEDSWKCFCLPSDSCF